MARTIGQDLEIRLTVIAPAGVIAIERAARAKR